MGCFVFLISSYFKYDALRDMDILHFIFHDCTKLVNYTLEPSFTLRSSSLRISYPNTAGFLDEQSVTNVSHVFSKSMRIFARWWKQWIIVFIANLCIRVQDEWNLWNNTGTFPTIFTDRSSWTRNLIKHNILVLFSSQVYVHIIATNNATKYQNIINIEIMKIPTFVSQ